MTGLLDQKRVERYIDNGMQENPTNPNGRYVGQIGVDPKTGKYRKEFNVPTGMASHYSPEQVARREEQKELKLHRKREEIARKRHEISRMKQELDELEER